MSRKSFQIGILGGGQLAWMLAQAARKHNFSVCGLSDSTSDPVCQLEIPTFRSIAEVVENSQKVLFENEFVDVSKLRGIQSDESSFFPSLSSIEYVQDKLNQKKLFTKLGLPTADYSIMEGDLTEWVKVLKEKFGSKKLVYKWSRFGYDGKGNLFDKAEVSSSLREFTELAKSKDAVVYAEEAIDFEAELAISICRVKDDVISLPLVLSRQEKGVCKEVKGPATNFNIAPNLEVEAKAFLVKISKELVLEGCLAGEFFLTESGDLLINELAPRVHNSAHYSLEACEMSQFECQVLAAMGELPHFSLRHNFFGMLNLLSPHSGGKLTRPASIEANFIQGAHLYWYGKEDLSSMRKMGHINYVAADLAGFEKIVDELKSWEKSFWQENQ